MYTTDGGGRVTTSKYNQHLQSAPVVGYLQPAQLSSGPFSTNPISDFRPHRLSSYPKPRPAKPIKRSPRMWPYGTGVRAAHLLWVTAQTAQKYKAYLDGDKQHEADLKAHGVLDNPEKYVGYEEGAVKQAYQLRNKYRLREILTQFDLAPKKLQALSAETLRRWSVWLGEMQDTRPIIQRFPRFLTLLQLKQARAKQKAMQVSEGVIGVAGLLLLGIHFCFFALSTLPLLGYICASIATACYAYNAKINTWTAPKAFLEERSHALEANFREVYTANSQLLLSELNDLSAPWQNNTTYAQMQTALMRP